MWTQRIPCQFLICRYWHKSQVTSLKSKELFCISKCYCKRNPVHKIQRPTSISIYVFSPINADFSLQTVFYGGSLGNKQ